MFASALLSWSLMGVVVNDTNPTVTAYTDVNPPLPSDRLSDLPNGQRRRLQVKFATPPLNSKIDACSLKWTSIDTADGQGHRVGVSLNSTGGTTWGNGSTEWQTFQDMNQNWSYTQTSQWQERCRGVSTVANYGWLFESGTQSQLGTRVGSFSLLYTIWYAGDANRDGIRWNNADIVLVLQGGRYNQGQPATWEQGDFNGDNQFNSLDVVAAQQ